MFTYVDLLSWMLPDNSFKLLFQEKKKTFCRIARRHRSLILRLYREVDKMI